MGIEVRFTPEGIHLPELDLWLDPREACNRAWISHAHSDHARGGHCRVIATPETIALYRARYEAYPPQPDFQPLAYGESVDLGSARLTVYPASHILGAAQLLIEAQGERLLYTGDIKYRQPLCGAKTEVPECDRIIIESTFGLPIYRFLTCEEAADRIADYARACLADGGVPVFIGYPLGRGQEIVHVLARAGIPVAVHGSIARFIPEYERAGYSFDGWERYEAKRVTGKALVVVPNFRAPLEAAGARPGGKSFRLAYVSGWARLDNARARVGAEELIPYSDHGDLGELLELIRLSKARHVHVVHGYTEPFAGILKGLGVSADAPLAASARAAAEDAEG